MAGKRPDGTFAGKRTMSAKGWKAALLAGSILMTCGSWVGQASAQDAEGQRVDLELVLAVDVSSSVDDAEFELQMRGIAEAFRNPDLVQAIRSAGNRGITVTLVQWSGEGSQAQVVDWSLISDAASSADFARKIDNAPRKLIGGQTSIAGALDFAVTLIETNTFEGARKVIDLSGDGRANVGPHPMDARDAAINAGITVNGLAIRNDEPFLDGYFAHSVIGGVGAFMMTAEDYEDYTAAIFSKLLREIGIPLADSAPADRKLAMAE